MLRPNQPVLSRHRLPRGYRVGLAVLWLTPLTLLTLTAVLRLGLTPALLDPRFVLPALIAALPSLYVWQEGIDVLPSGIVRRVHVPRYFPNECLETWYFDARPDRRVLTVWDAGNRKLVECRAGHLTDLPALLDPRFVLPALMAGLPSLYVWQEGIDVLPGGIVRRVHLPRYIPNECLKTWYFDARPDRRVLTVWDADNRKLVECRAGHLTDLPALLAVLKARARWRGFPR